MIKSNQPLLDTCCPRLLVASIEFSMLALLSAVAAAVDVPFSSLSLPVCLTLAAFVSLSLCASQKSSSPPQSLLPNPQTDEFLAMLGLDHVVTVPCPGFQPRFGGGGGGGGGSGHGEGSGEGDAEGAAAVQDKYEIDLDAARDDPNEIQLD